MTYVGLQSSLLPKFAREIAWRKEAKRLFLRSLGLSCSRGGKNLYGKSTRDETASALGCASTTVSAGAIGISAVIWMILFRTAYKTNSLTECNPSLRMILLRWVSAVLTLRFRCRGSLSRKGPETAHRVNVCAKETTRPLCWKRHWSGNRGSAMEQPARCCILSWEMIRPKRICVRILDKLMHDPFNAL